MTSSTTHPLILKAEVACQQTVWPAIETTCHQVTQRITEGFIQHRVGEEHFYSVTGYGHNDLGRDVLDAIFAHALQAEAALVRPQLVSGTHALAVALRSLLHHGDTLLCITGAPYDTLEEVIGLRGEHPQSLIGQGAQYQELNLIETQQLTQSEETAIQEAKVIYLQRSRGYSLRPTLTIADLTRLIQLVRSVKPDALIMVDNCYGEFIEVQEPTAIGADLMAGSLIKNPGGGLAPTGGYIAGRSNLVEQAANTLTCPGIGPEGGYLFDLTRTLLQGLFLAPNVVKEALKGMTMAAHVFEQLTIDVCPRWDAPRGDLINAVHLGSADRLKQACRIIQQRSPINSFVTPVPSQVPGYESEVIMAGGTFIDGSSIELSADAPLREPYVLFFQGGLVYSHTRYVVAQLITNLRSN